MKNAYNMGSVYLHGDHAVNSAIDVKKEPPYPVIGVKIWESLSAIRIQLRFISDRGSSGGVMDYRRHRINLN